MRSFDKLLEVGVSPYLGFIPSLSTLSMFELNEVVRGRLIGPRTWDRIVGNFFRIFLLSVIVQKFSWLLVLKLCMKCMLDMKNAGNGRETRVH